MRGDSFRSGSLFLNSKLYVRSGIASTLRSKKEMISRKLNKAFKGALCQLEYFSQWQKEKPKEFWNRDDVHALGVDLQLEKYWEQTGGKIAVNLFCGHKWEAPQIFPGWVSNDLFYSSVRLSKDMKQDHWWTVHNEQEIEIFAQDLKRLLVSNAVPWFEKVKTKEGFLEWYSTVNTMHACFPFILEISGVEGLRKKLIDWLWTYPRNIERTLDWLVGVDVISQNLSSEIRIASMQEVSRHKELMNPIIMKFEQGRI
jgi:hypothetical protein